MAHVLLVVCDRCQHDGARTEATEEITVAFNFKKPRRLDLCAEHAKPYAELREFAESEGVTLRGASTAEPVVLNSDPCPECGRRFTDGRGLASHVRLAHTEAAPMTCPECGQVMSGKQGLGNHIRRAHPNRQES